MTGSLRGREPGSGGAPGEKEGDLKRLLLAVAGAIAVVLSVTPAESRAQSLFARTGVGRATIGSSDATRFGSGRGLWGGVGVFWRSYRRVGTDAMNGAPSTRVEGHVVPRHGLPAFRTKLAVLDGALCGVVALHSEQLPEESHHPPPVVCVGGIVPVVGRIS